MKKFNISNIKKGPQWFSLKSKYVPKLLNYENQNIFKNCCCGDELFVQTIFHRLDNGKHIKDDNAEAARYIDWDRGKPYTFKDTDISELKEKINSNFAFVRKVNDTKIGKELFDL
ncbi:beta-1,6-N-acetylglucosaminyltransferase [Limosilactobacillus reuteri]